MSNPNGISHPSKPALAIRVDELREALKQIPVNLLAERTGASYQAIGPGRGEFRLSLFDSPTIVTYPGIIGVDAKDDELPLPFQAVLAYYFHTSDGASLTGQWVSFAELPDGRMYNQAFQGYSGNLLTKAFNLDIQSFRRACASAGGRPVEFADAAFAFNALPHIPLLVTYWLGEDEFPSASKVLFDPTAVRHLPIDVCAILGGMLASRILKEHNID